MFGHHDDHDGKDEHGEPVAHDEHSGQSHEEHPTETTNQVVHPGAEEHEQAPAEEPPVVAAESASDVVATPADTPSADDSAGPQDTDTFDAGATDSAGDDQPWQHPGTPIDDDSAHDKHDEGEEPLKDEVAEPISDVIYPAGLPKAPTFQHGGSSTPSPAPTNDDDDAGSHELVDIKIKALDELAPLIDDLDMPPEEKFRTIMMMIQASDNQDLVNKAYAAAHSIEDEKTRAQALLDVVNEINYFTQPRQNQPEV